MISRSCNPRVISSYYVDLKALLLTEGVIVATCLSTFVGARQLAPEPSASSPSALSSSSLCSRALATTLWGAAFAFFSLMADAWPAAKAHSSVSSDASFTYMFFSFLMLAPVAPLNGMNVALDHMFRTLKFREILSTRVNSPELTPGTMSICNKLWRAIDVVLVILFGIKQPRGFLQRTRIVSNTETVLGMSYSTKIPLTHVIGALSPEKGDKIADAFTIGHKTAENSCLMLLNEAGRLALLESSGILPNYKQLRFLDGKSGIATLILAIQAIGYVTSIAYRAIHHLPVSPIEAIGFALSMLVIVHSVVHSVGVVSQSALVIYLNPTQEREMLHKCESTRWSNADYAYRTNAFLGTVVVGSVVMAFTILVEWHVIRISWLVRIGPILYLLSLIPQLFYRFIVVRYTIAQRRASWLLVSSLLVLGNLMSSFGGIVVSIVATILNWQSDKFDSRTPSVIHNLPFLG